MIDYDARKDRPALSKQALIDAIHEAAPGLRAGSAIWWCSSSSYIYNGDTELNGLRGQRLYLLVQDATDSKRALQTLNERLWLNGHGHIEVSKAGSLLTRCLADEAMSSSARLDYIGPVVCEPPINQRRPRPEVISTGGWIDTKAAIPHLTPEEQQRYDALLREAKAAAQPEADSVRAERDEASTSELSKRLIAEGIPEEAAQQRARSAVAAARGGELAGDFTIILDDGVVVTVSEILKQRETYDKRMCLDPTETEYLNHKAVGHLNLSGNAPTIFSHAHGGATYHLVAEPSRVYQQAARAGIDPGCLLNTDGRGKHSHLAGNHLANRVAPALKGRFAYEAERDLWHGWTGSHWQADQKAARVRSIAHSLLEVGCHPLGFDTRRLSSAIELMQSGEHLPLRLAGGNYLALKNGLLDLDTKEFTEASPSHALTWSIPFEFDPDADCPNIKAWLKQALQGDESMVAYVRSVLAAILTGRHDLQTFFYFLGRAGTGKGTLFRLVGAMLGKENIHSTTLRDLETNRFETSSLVGKRLVVITDAARYSGEVEILKQLTGGDTLRCEEKNRPSATFRYEGTVLIASNEDLVSSDKTSGLDRRRAVVKFNRSATAEDKAAWEARGGEEQVLHSEIPGLINWLVALDRDTVTSAVRNPPTAVKAANAEAMESNNQVARWLKLECRRHPNKVTAWGKLDEVRFNGVVRLNGSDDQLYPAYLEWARGEGLKDLSLNRFKTLLVETCETIGWSVETGGRQIRDRKGLCGVRGLELLERDDA